MNSAHKVFSLTVYALNHTHWVSRWMLYFDAVIYQDYK